MFCYLSFPNARVCFCFRSEGRRVGKAGRVGWCLVRGGRLRAGVGCLGDVGLVVVWDGAAV